MPAVRIRDELWDELTDVARRQKRTPTAVARQALREYIRQANDEELLERSSSVARRARFTSRETETIVRRYRRSRRSG
jgi:predicted transcriptional regulator